MIIPKSKTKYTKILCAAALLVQSVDNTKVQAKYIYNLCAAELLVKSVDSTGVQN